MVMETGATTGIFPSDERTRAWLADAGPRGALARAGRRPGRRCTTRRRRSTSASLEPLIALPSSPGNVVPVREAAGEPTRQVCVGSSVNSSFEDLAIVAAVLRGRTVSPELDLTVTPGSRQILDMIVRSGVYADLLSAGARILEPACGPCIGMGQAPAAGAVSVRTFNRNFPGRSGTAGRPRLPLLARDRGGDRAARRDRRPARARRAAGADAAARRTRRSTTARSSCRPRTAAGSSSRRARTSSRRRPCRRSPMRSPAAC